MAIVQLHSVSKIYESGLFRRSRVAALQEVSLNVEAGRIFGLLGPNGAGKTTLVKVLLSIVSPTSGTASVLGKPLGSVRIREQCGYLPENHRYPQFLTGLETLLLFGRLHGMKGNSLREKAEQLLKTVGLSEWKNTKIKKYSKGMLQRLGLAQAILNDPPLLFLDEPTDGVDPIGRKEIRDMLRELQSGGTTIFLNSHILSEVELICDQVAILNHGQVLKVGDIGSITDTRPEYEIQLSSPPVESEIAAIAPGVRVDGRTLVVPTSDQVDVNRVIDLLRSRGVMIESVVKRRSTLEDSFVRLLRREPQ